eukprot:PhF_6_TR8822/c0_g1_i1/m.14001
MTENVSMEETWQQQNMNSNSQPLFPYRSDNGSSLFNRLMATGTVFMVFCFTFFFLSFSFSSSNYYALDGLVPITTVQRVALILHGAYFMVLPFAFEVLIDYLLFPMGKLPNKPDNLYWMMTCLSAELFFVTGLCYFLMAAQSSVPRWTLLIPIAQGFYNMKNDIVWVGLGHIWSPERKRMWLMALDWITVGAFMVIYVHHFFTA